MDIKTFQEEVGGIVDEVLSVYEESVGAVEQIIATPYRFVELEEEIFNTRKEREQISVTLKVLLANNDSLRKKDFDCMMDRIFDAQEKRESEVRCMLRSYFDGQKEMASVLREKLRVFRANLGGENQELIGQFRAFADNLFQEREQRKKYVEGKLHEYNQSQQEIAGALKKLLEKGKELRFRDLKNLLTEFENSRVKRKREQSEREKEVADMLRGFKEKRLSGQTSRYCKGGS
ncbi:MAG: hypothetical protein MI684_03140 [Chlorobiales bacterium]|nr:hypothetical protein [Chlorobiales bacterium]